MMFRAKYVRYGTIHEVYDRFGIPVNSALYKSEPYFSEGIGMYLYAEKLCKVNENINGLRSGLVKS